MKTKYQITCDLFMIPHKDNQKIIYAPKVGFLCEANSDLINLISTLETIDTSSLNAKQLQVLEYLEENGVLNGPVESSVKHENAREFAPTRVTLFPTNQCNLRCIYCYASAGDHKPSKMNWNYAVGAIRTIITNAKKLGGNTISLGFHGGGEPLYPWQFVKKIVEYAEEESKMNNLQLSVSSATNGLLSEKQLEWIVKHFSDLNISFDGLPHVQDYHRPMPEGQGSFKFVDKTFKYLDQRGFNYGIRSTFSDFNLDLMEESYDFIINNYKPKTIHFEPAFQGGRCKADEMYKVNLEKFAEYFKRIESKNRNNNVRFVYSGCRIESLSNSFCGLTSDSFSITPEGNITSCFETTSLEDPRAKYFFYGKIDEYGNIHLDEKKRKYLNGLTVDNLSYCSNCFAKWHCSGDCVAKIGHHNFYGERGHDRCHLNRQMVKDKLINLLTENQG